MSASINLISYNIRNHIAYHPLGATQGKGQSLTTQANLSSPQVTDQYSLNHFASPKLGEDYTKSDALMQLWKEAHTINLNDSNSTVGLCMDPTEADLAALENQLETDGLGGQINFSQVSGDFETMFATVHAGNLGGAIDYLVSRTAALEGKLNRNFSGEELQAQLQELNNVFQQGKERLIDSYAGRLQDALGLSDADAQSVRDSLGSLIFQRLQTYRDAQAAMPDALTGTKDSWLLNHYEYMASQLRQTAETITDRASGGDFTLGDLRAAGEVAGAYQTIYQGVATGKGGDEAFLALDLSMIDMKTETLIQRGLVSDNMAKMLQTSLAQRHQNALDVSDQRLAVRQQEALSGEAPIPQINRELFQSIYDAVLDSFHQNGGDALAAIRDGVAFGKEATAQAHRENPSVTRWGISKESYWERFYTSSQVSDWHGGTRTQKSEYQSYADSWQHFLSTISSVQGRYLEASGADAPAYTNSLINTQG